MDVDEVVIPVPPKTARDARVVVLFAAPGETIRRNQLLALLEGDKGVLQVFSPLRGMVKEIQVKLGERVVPGTPILTLDRIDGRRRSEQPSAIARRLPALPVPRAAPNGTALASPTLAAFQGKIEQLLGAPLTGPAALAVADMWTHWSAFCRALSRKDLQVQRRLEYRGVSPSRRAGYFDGPYRLERAARPLVLVGLLSVVFLWQAAIALIALGLAAHFTAVYLKRGHARAIGQQFALLAEQAPCETTMANLCAHYILGMVRLTSPNGEAQWPEYPSSVLSGTHERIPGTQSRSPG